MDWSCEEVEAIVADYLHMRTAADLGRILREQRPVPAAFARSIWRALATRAIG